jgi:putative salt-induced outer membrane protein
VVSVCLGLGWGLFFGLLPLNAGATMNHWLGSFASFGFSNLTGNTRVLSLNGEINLLYTKKKWTNQFNSSINYGEDSGTVNKKKYFVQDQANYFLGEKEKNYLSLLANSSIDYFSPYNYVSVISTAYGREVIKSKKIVLSAQAGPGFRRTKERVGGSVFNRFIVRPQIQLVWKLTPDTHLVETASMEMGKPYQFYQSTTSLTNKILKHLATSISFQIDHYSSLPPNEKDDDKKTDTITNVSLVYTF